ncbi:helix-turn-helix domain-containing protein [Rhizobium sp. WL3]|uniref:helix-turn-helix domain-containing protein n=1 Tax=Rhizobium sp. WL3 TaxID=2603277 RepID=UPI001FEEDFBC|nr:helix-turn-helix domain-containing protein [Rhizobium sp. WL3]
MAAAKRRGVKFGRPHDVSDADIATAHTMLGDVAKRQDIAKGFEVSLLTLRKALSDEEEDIPGTLQTNMG